MLWNDPMPAQPRGRAPLEMPETAERDTPDGPRLGVSSNGAWFPVGPARAHLA